MAVELIKNATQYGVQKATVKQQTTGNNEMTKAVQEQKSANDQALKELIKDTKSDDQGIKSAVNQANSKMRQSKTSCEFTYHEQTKQISIKIIDDETKEVIREIPSEDSIRMVEKMLELAGILVDERR